MTDFITQKLTVNPNGVGDFETEWWTQEDWDNYIPKAKGLQDLEPFEVEVTMAVNPLFDRVDEAHGATVESYRMAVVDLSKVDVNKSMPIFYGTKENN